MKIHFFLLISFFGFIALAMTKAKAQSAPAVTADSVPVCYSQDDLMRDLKYGNCQALNDKKPEEINFCPELSDKIKNNPQSIAMQFFDKINEGNFFISAIGCKSAERFLKKTMAANSVLGSPVLFRFANKCNAEGILFARVFGAKEVIDKKSKLTPSVVIKNEIDQQSMKLAVETDAPKSTELKKHIDQCNKALLSLTQVKFKLEDIRSLKFPTEVKVLLLKEAHDRGLGDENIERMISSTQPSP